jgi:hypothetical protein
MSIVDYIKFSGRMPSAYEDLLNHFMIQQNLMQSLGILKNRKINKIEDK